MIPTTQPAAQTIAMRNQDLRIEYQLNIATDTLLIVKILACITAIITVLICLAAVMSLKNRAKFMSAVSDQIKKDLSLVSGVSDEYYNDIIEIPELKEGIKDIKRLIERQVNSSTALEKEAYTDQLTGLTIATALFNFMKA